MSYVRYTKKELEKFCEEIAGIMDELKTDQGKDLLAKVTQQNYAKMVELEVNLAESEKQLENLRKIKQMEELLNGISM